jgi:hypothetical protein
MMDHKKWQWKRSEDTGVRDMNAVRKFNKIYLTTSGKISHLFISR